EEEAPPIRVDAQHDLDDEDRDDDAVDEVERLARTLHHDWVGLEPEDHGIDDDEPDDAALERLRLDEFAYATAQARSRSADNGGRLRRGGGHDRKHYGDQASPRLRLRMGRGARSPRNDRAESTTKPRLSASRPISIRNPIASRLLSVTSASTSRPTSTSRIDTTKRSSTCPDELRTRRTSSTGHSTRTSSAVDRCHGRMLKRTQATPSRS